MGLCHPHFYVPLCLYCDTLFQYPFYFTRYYGSLVHCDPPKLLRYPPSVILANVMGLVILIVSEPQFSIVPLGISHHCPVIAVLGTAFCSGTLKMFVKAVPTPPPLSPAQYSAVGPFCLI